MKKFSDEQKTKLVGTIVSGLLCGGYFLLLIILIIYCQFVASEKMPGILFLLMVCILLLPFIGILYSFISRVREIRSGEEEEASKY